MNNYLKGAIVMITKNNYYSEITRIGVDKLSKSMQEMHQLIDDLTDKGKTWENYDQEPEIQESVNKMFKKLGEWIETNESKPDTVEKPKEKKAEKKVRKPRVKQSVPKQEKKKPTREIPEFVPADPLMPSVGFINRYRLLHGKQKAREQLMKLLSDLQKAIKLKLIRKTDPHSVEIEAIQGELVDLVNRLKEGEIVEITIKNVDLYKTIVQGISDPVLNVFKRYLSIQGKTGMDEELSKLADTIQKVIKRYGWDSGELPKKEVDRHKLYFLDWLGNKIHDYFKGEIKFIPIEDQSLEGIRACYSELGFFPELAINVAANLVADRIMKSTKKTTGVVSSMDLQGMEFDELPLDAPWSEVLGRVTVPFNIMAYGGPGQGKSTFMIRFASYLAGKGKHVLIVSSEEGISATLKEKFERMNAFNENIKLAVKLPEDLSPYDLIVIDSVNDLQLSSGDIERLFDRYNPDKKSFLLIFRSTKNGSYRGAQTFENAVDVSIRLNEGNTMVQKNRFGGNGAMNVFDLVGCQT